MSTTMFLYMCTYTASTGLHIKGKKEGNVTFLATLAAHKFREAGKERKT